MSMGRGTGSVGEKTLKLIYNIIGTVSLVFAFIGIVLPIIPTTPFVLLSAACYYKGSERLHGWLSRNEVFGPIIRDYEEHRGMRKATKVKALTVMWAAVLASALLILDTLTMRALVLLIAVIGTVSMLRIKTIE
jgi:uncharacterized membrane protein YbaN (DUF454 family)